MSSLNSTVSTNSTFVRPQFFYINGFSNIPHVKFYFIFLCFVYTVTVIANSFIMFIIFMNQNLHTPKYSAVFNLAVVDMGGSTALIPKMIETFLFDSQFITYEACLVNMFFVHLFTFMQSLTLLALAYDRFVAICFPLNYHSVITNGKMVLILAIIWIMTAGLMLIAVGLVTRLSFCKSIVINSYFCDHGPVCQLACNSNSPNHIYAQFCISIVLFIPLILIALSYMCIVFALLKIASGEERLRAMKTCTSHLILVAVFYLPICGTYLAAILSTIHPDARILNTSLSSTIPPMLNPIIYTLKTEEILETVKRLYNRNKISAAF
uniref:Olfactory receptor 51F2-like n=1 Tax=Lepisosteus oculatus TaxID=7918 RepID=W5NM91_LEPOC|nr:PREDICTED: olfactory receptor 51F2-like [Lepisosteus oculatus]